MLVCRDRNAARPEEGKVGEASTRLILKSIVKHARKRARTDYGSDHALCGFRCDAMLCVGWMVRSYYILYSIRILDIYTHIVQTCT